jgi:hypothetical protein
MATEHYTLRITDQRSAQIAALEKLTGLTGPAAVVDFALATALAHYGQEETMDALYYQIDDEKLEAVADIVNRETDPAATPDLIRSHICADWSEGQEHQDWIDEAEPEEIADWLASFYQGRHV